MLIGYYLSVRNENNIQYLMLATDKQIKLGYSAAYSLWLNCLRCYLMSLQSPTFVLMTDSYPPTIPMLNREEKSDITVMYIQSSINYTGNGNPLFSIFWGGKNQLFTISQSRLIYYLKTKTCIYCCYLKGGGAQLF